MVLGRFDITGLGGFGCGDFRDTIKAEIAKLVERNGIMTSDASHPHDLVKRTLACLELMLGREEAHIEIRTGTHGDGDPEDLLRDWIDRQFWKYHSSLYRRRPVYWPLQSRSKKFTVWIFQERLANDTLFKVRSDFVRPKIRSLEGRSKELKAKALTGDIRERRAAEKEGSQLNDLLDDLQEFGQTLNHIVQRGYSPHIEDGVLLNAAPLWELLPAWPETKKAWQKLEFGEYDWAYLAMEYWPDRVKEKCRSNKSFAIAHGLA